jgi:hypothetical protein
MDWVSSDKATSSEAKICIEKATHWALNVKDRALSKEQFFERLWGLSVSLDPNSQRVDRKIALFVSVLLAVSAVSVVGFIGYQSLKIIKGTIQYAMRALPRAVRLEYANSSKSAVQRAHSCPSPESLLPSVYQSAPAKTSTVNQTPAKSSMLSAVAASPELQRPPQLPNRPTAAAKPSKRKPRRIKAETAKSSITSKRKKPRSMKTEKRPSKK